MREILVVDVIPSEFKVHGEAAEILEKIKENNLTDQFNTYANKYWEDEPVDEDEFIDWLTLNKEEIYKNIALIDDNEYRKAICNNMIKDTQILFKNIITASISGDPNSVLFVINMTIKSIDKNLVKNVITYMSHWMRKYANFEFGDIDVHTNKKNTSVVIYC